MDAIDRVAMALCAWKECRSGGVLGMQSVINVIMNRAMARKISIYQVVYEPWQFSSMTAPKDRQLYLKPDETDKNWATAVSLVYDAEDGKLEDITQGATNYYATYIQPPDWSKQMTKTVEIAKQVFFK